MAKAILRTKLEESSFLTSDSTTKLQSSKKYGTSTKTHIDQGSGIEVPDTNSHTYCQLIYDKWNKNK